jgi:hypothetical protein
VYGAARALGLPVTASHTPQQVGLLLDTYLAESARPARLTHDWQRISQTLQEIVETYIQTTYGAQLTKHASTERMISQWQSARVYLWLARISHELGKLTRRS